MKRAFVAVAATALMALSGVASAASVADNQCYCKKQGSSSCAGGSECSTAHRKDLPNGQAKKC